MMRPRIPRPRWLLCAGVLASCLAPAATAPQSAPAPVQNIRIPVFTNDGFRLWMLRGSEVRPLGKDQVEVRDLNLTAFSGDAADRTETVILSPVARVDPVNRVASGDSTIRVLNYTENFEATGTGWTYDQKRKRILIARNVSVTLHVELKDLLK